MLKIKKMVVGVSLFIGASLFAGDVCDNVKIDSLFLTATSQGAKILKKEASIDVLGFCEVYMMFNNKLDLIYADVEKNQFIAGGNMVNYDPTTKSYSPKNMSKIAEIMSSIEAEQATASISLLKDKKKLEEFYAMANIEFSSGNDKNVLNKKYDVLLFESLLCGYCKELNTKLETAFINKNIKIFKFLLPLSQEDFNNLKDNHYKDENKLLNAIKLKDELNIDGVPLVLVRDAKTKEIVEIIKSPSAPENFKKLINYLM